MKININESSMAQFLVAQAGCAQSLHENEGVNCMPDDDGMYDINITLNGAEINAGSFLRDLQERYEESVRERAADLLSLEYDSMIEQIRSIQDTLRCHDELFEKKAYGRDGINTPELKLFRVDCNMTDSLGQTYRDTHLVIGPSEEEVEEQQMEKLEPGYIWVNEVNEIDGYRVVIK